MFVDVCMCRHSCVCVLHFWLSYISGFPIHSTSPVIKKYIRNMSLCVVIIPLLFVLLTHGFQLCVHHDFQSDSYLYASEDSMCVNAILRAAAVHHGGAGVTVVACCMAANTEIVIVIHLGSYIKITERKLTL